MKDQPIDRDLADLRREYRIAPLGRRDLANDPLRQFDAWFADALRVEAMDANAMTLATASATGQPSCRTVLLKSYDEQGFVFYTNRDSRKAEDIESNSRVALLFYWYELHRQIRIEGSAAATPPEEDRAYFARRPRDSQISAWASPQSRDVDSRVDLEQRVTETEKRFGERDIELPPFWGGFRVAADYFEFWQGRENRLHDRFSYTLNERESAWRISRLGP